MWQIWLIYAFAAVAFALATVASNKIESQRIPQKQERFRGREKKSLLQINKDYFLEYTIDQSRFEYLWMKAATILKLDPYLLLPSDRFDIELSPVKGFFVEDEIVDLSDFYEDECKKIGILSRRDKLLTLGEMIIILSTKSAAESH